MTTYTVVKVATPPTRVIPISTQAPLSVAQILTGPPGPAGPAGDSTYAIYEFSAPSSVWTINHTLGRFPDVTVLDSTGTEVLTDIDRPTISQVVITFASPTTGRVFLI